MLIISWNVAGLSTTVHRIHDNCSDTTLKGDGSKSTNSNSALQKLFRRHGADIVCLQEHKIPRRCLTDRSEPRLFAKAAGSKRIISSADSSAGVDYESFWSCCIDTAKKGLNGVVTYARTGTVQSANSAPLQSPELDAQGRCLMTHHQTFVLFNVYVPCRGGPFKLKFLRALRQAMQAQRADGFPVILVGDLNISYDRNDVYWKDRVVHIDNVLREEADITASGNTGSATVAPWKIDVAKNWQTILNALAMKEVVSTVTTNSATREAYNKFRVSVVVDGDRRVFLGNHETSEEDCMHYYNFDAYSYWDDEIQERVQMRGKNVVTVGVLAELMLKICNVQWTANMIRQIAEEWADVDHQSPSRKWLHDVLCEDGMVDAFRHFYPDAKARFTCWNQNKNCRYVNQGSRIDYTLIDRSLLPYVQQGESTLRCGVSVADGKDLSEAAALSAATANGRFQPAAYEGGGLMEASPQALDSQFGPPHTGHIYTPPTFSDHIGVSVLLRDDILPTRNLVINTNDSATRKAQPHLQQKSVTDFFRRGSEAGKVETVGTKRVPQFPSSLKANSKRGKANVKAPANSILNHFQRTTR